MPSVASAFARPTPEQARRRRQFERDQQHAAFAVRPDGTHLLWLYRELFNRYDGPTTLYPRVAALRELTAVDPHLPPRVIAGTGCRPSCRRRSWGSAA